MPPGSLFPLDPHLLAVAEGRYAVIASAGYDYVPVLGAVIDAAFGLSQQTVHIGRRNNVSEFGFAMTAEDWDAVED